MVKIFTITLKSILKFLCVLLVFHITLVPSAECQNERDDILVKYDVRVKNIDTKRLVARIDLSLIIYNFPIDADSVVYQLAGLDHPQVNLRRINPNSYQGDLYDIEWYISGMGDLYPFDYYTLDMNIDEGNIWYNIGNHTIYGYQPTDLVWINQHRTDNASYAVFDGILKRQLEDTWKTDKTTFIPSNVTKSDSFRVHLERISRIPFHQFVLPLLIAEFTVLFSALLYIFPKTEQIRIYGVFTSFSPLSMLAIRDFLPHRSTMCIPEFYSLILFGTSMILILRHMIMMNLFDKKIVEDRYIKYIHYISIAIVSYLLKRLHIYLINYMYFEHAKFPILISAFTVINLVDIMFFSILLISFYYLLLTFINSSDYDNLLNISNKILILFKKG